MLDPAGGSSGHPGRSPRRGLCGTLCCFCLAGLLCFDTLFCTSQFCFSCSSSHVTVPPCILASRSCLSAGTSECVCTCETGEGQQSGLGCNPCSDDFGRVSSLSSMQWPGDRAPSHGAAQRRDVQISAWHSACLASARPMAAWLLGSKGSRDRPGQIQAPYKSRVLGTSEVLPSKPQVSSKEQTWGGAGQGRARL